MITRICSRVSVIGWSIIQLAGCAIRGVATAVNAAPTATQLGIKSVEVEIKGHNKQADYPGECKKIYQKYICHLPTPETILMVGSAPGFTHPVTICESRILPFQVSGDVRVVRGKVKILHLFK